MCSDSRLKSTYVIESFESWKHVTHGLIFLSISLTFKDTQLHDINIEAYVTWSGLTLIRALRGPNKKIYEDYFQSHANKNASGSITEHLSFCQKAIHVTPQNDWNWIGWGTVNYSGLTFKSKDYTTSRVCKRDTLMQQPWPLKVLGDFLLWWTAIAFYNSNHCQVG